MKKYLNFLLTILFSLLIAASIIVINSEIYSSIFGGFPYPILKFGYILLTLWFFVITILLFTLRKVVALIKTTYFLDLVMLICGIIGLLGFVDYQVEQQFNNLEQIKANYEYRIERLEAAKIHHQRNLNFYKETNYDAFDMNYEYYFYFTNNIDSIFNEDFDKNNFLKELNKRKKEENYADEVLIEYVEKYIDAKEKYQETEIEYNDIRNNDFKGFYLMSFITALIFGIAKITIVFIKENYTN